MDSVLEGVKVLDLGTMAAGPLVTEFLADFGADVVKVDPLEGDVSRFVYTTPFLGVESRMYIAYNRSKRGIAVDMTKDEGKKIIWDLLAKSDVVLENFRPGVIERLGFGYDAVHSFNPRLIYVSIKAWGAGPFSEQPGYDRCVQALTGIMGARRMSDGAPISTPGYFIDHATAFYTAYGVALALLYREKTGKGQKIENTLLGMGILMQSTEFVYVANDAAKEEPGHYEATWEAFPCKEGGYILSVVATNREWVRLCRALGLENLIDDPMFKDARNRTENARELRTILEGIYSTNNRDYWAELLQKEGCAYSPVLDRREVYDHPQMIESKAFMEVQHPKAGLVKMMGLPLKLSETPPKLKYAAPLLGQHTKEILRELGYTKTKIDTLEQKQVIKCAEVS